MLGSWSTALCSAVGARLSSPLVGPIRHCAARLLCLGACGPAAPHRFPFTRTHARAGGYRSPAMFPRFQARPIETTPGRSPGRSNCRSGRRTSADPAQQRTPVFHDVLSGHRGYTILPMLQPQALWRSKFRYLQPLVWFPGSRRRVSVFELNFQHIILRKYYLANVRQEADAGERPSCRLIWPHRSRQIRRHVSSLRKFVVIHFLANIFCLFV